MPIKPMISELAHEEARLFQKMLSEGEYNYGLEGQLNIGLPRKNAGEYSQEPHSQLRDRTYALAKKLNGILGHPEETIKAQEGRIVLKQPDQDMPYILRHMKDTHGMDIAVDTKFDKSPNIKPSGNAVHTGFVKQTPTTRGGWQSKVHNDELAIPDTNLDRLLLAQATDEVTEERPGAIIKGGFQIVGRERLVPNGFRLKEDGTLDGGGGRSR